MIQDPISDLLTRIRNGCKAKHRYIEIPHSKFKEEVVKVLKQKGFVAHLLVKEEKGRGTMRIFLKYTDQREPVIKGLKRMSKLSLRRYVSHKDIPRVLGGLGISIVSTSKGVLDGEQARKDKLGGELLCIAW
ncbi:MAG: 30S ribosomal protein S8 [Chlamydiales bacterium]|nr:30S ribosomal protein S8 [Chlamydiales bacterium]MCH9619783.1 30S ribosomal protein S8 [Chlamydiales bacterium]MCH9623389.1 30S ribosomal protein S8 [Chlamydiales bacterium]